MQGTFMVQITFSYKLGFRQITVLHDFNPFLNFLFNKAKQTFLRSLKMQQPTQNEVCRSRLSNVKSPAGHIRRVYLRVTYVFRLHSCTWQSSLMCGSVHTQVRQHVRRRWRHGSMTSLVSAVWRRLTWCAGCPPWSRDPCWSRGTRCWTSCFWCCAVAERRSLCLRPFCVFLLLQDHPIVGSIY